MHRSLCWFSCAPAHISVIKILPHPYEARESWHGWSGIVGLKYHDYIRIFHAVLWISRALDFMATLPEKFALSDPGFKLPFTRSLTKKIAHRAGHMEKLQKSPPFPSPIGAMATNHWCIIWVHSFKTKRTVKTDQTGRILWLIRLR